MPRLHLLLMPAFLLACLCPRVESFPSIAVYDSPDAGRYCDCATPDTPPVLELPLFESKTLYVLAHRVDEGIQGAEFGISGFPSSGIILSVSPNPAAVFSQSSLLLTVVGSVLAFDACQLPSSPGGPVLLYTIVCTTLEPFAPRTLRLTGVFPNSPNTVTPNVILCDGPVFTAEQAHQADEVVLQSAEVIAVESKSWSTIKGLYKGR